MEITWHKTWYTNFVLQINQNQLTIFSKTCQCALIRGLVLHMGHSAHLGTATCPSSKLVPKFEKGDNLMKHMYLAYGGNG